MSPFVDLFYEAGGNDNMLPSRYFPNNNTFNFVTQVNERCKDIQNRGNSSEVKKITLYALAIFVLYLTVKKK